MEKQAIDHRKKSALMDTGKDRLSRIILIGAIILYSASLVLLASLAFATEAKVTDGALIKVNSTLDGRAFQRLNATVKSVNGNILAIDIRHADYVLLNKVKGFCAGHLDQEVSGSNSADHEAIRNRFSGADVIVGILDNSGVLSAEELSQLEKVERASNVGFVSYRSDDPGSNVIMRNLVGGESNLVQALAYMQEYARTVNRPLVIETLLSGIELANPLFIQVCQKFADAGVQFLGVPELTTGLMNTKAAVQLAFTMFNAETGQITDRSDFWAISEVKEQQIMLLGSDNSTCLIRFETENGFDKVFMSNSSADVIMVTALSSSGDVNYFHVKRKETALIPRELGNGTPMLEDGLGGIYPYHTKMAMFNGAKARNQFVALQAEEQAVELGHAGVKLRVGSPSSRTLALSLTELTAPMQIQIVNENGDTVYRNVPAGEIQSIRTRIDLSEGEEGLYYLNLTSADFHRSIALRMN